MSENNSIKSEQAKLILKLASAAATVARAKNRLLKNREKTDSINQKEEQHLITLLGLDYLAVKKNPTNEEKRLVDEHERTRLARSRARIEAEFPQILASNDDDK